MHNRPVRLGIKHVSVHLETYTIHNNSRPNSTVLFRPGKDVLSKSVSLYKDEVFEISVQPNLERISSFSFLTW